MCVSIWGFECGILNQSLLNHDKQTDIDDELKRKKLLTLPQFFQWPIQPTRRNTTENENVYKNVIEKLRFMLTMRVKYTIIRTNRFHAVPRDVCDDVVAVKLYDCPVERAPNAANQNKYATICVSNEKNEKENYPKNK